MLGAAPFVDCGGRAALDVDASGAADFVDASRWSAFDVSGAFSSYYLGFAGAAFDGRYVYFAPIDSYTPVLRYDTKEPFAAGSAWSTFDVGTVHPTPYSTGYEGAVFDGRYVYFVPRLPSFDCDMACGSDGVVMRLDTQGEFTAASSWSSFNALPLGGVRGFSGGVFDGRYVYFVPIEFSSSSAMRYDTQKPFTDAASWETHVPGFDSGSGQGGGVFDGRYVYFAGRNGGASYDTQGSFTEASSWSRWSAQFGPSTAFDGRFVYFASGTGLTRHDTKANLSASTSWSSFVITGAKQVPGDLLDVGRTAFDGRYLYIAGPPVERYDTQPDVADTWAAFDVTTIMTSPIPGGANLFSGMVFDGRYVYFVPTASSVFVRYDAKSPPSMPSLPGWHGSFF